MRVSVTVAGVLGFGVMGSVAPQVAMAVIWLVGGLAALALLEPFWHVARARRQPTGEHGRVYR